jgi:acetyl-CoA carboxylase carboxyltransferase component
MHCSISGCADYFANDEEESSEFVRVIFETLNIPRKK